MLKVKVDRLVSNLPSANLIGQFKLVIVQVATNTAFLSVHYINPES